MSKKVLLYSGGTDSWLIDKLWKPDQKIYIDIEGRYSEVEKKRLPEDVEVVKMPHLGRFEDVNAHIPFRNLYFLLVGANFGDKVCFGATAGDANGRDKTIEFIQLAESIMNYCSHGGSEANSGKDIVIEKRFVKMNKYQLVDEYLRNGGDLKTFVEDTFSCYSPQDDKECWGCKACYKKFLLSTYFGYVFPEDIQKKMLDYLKNKVIPKSQLKAGTYFADRPGGDGEYAVKAMDKFFRQYNLDWRDFQ